MAVPLSVLDLVPAASGVSAGDAVRNALDLARRTEAAGYLRYWIAEHHLNPGVMGASPPIVITMVAGATERIRVGSGAVLLGHQTPLVGRRAVRPDRRPLPGPHRPRPRTLRRPPHAVAPGRRRPSRGRRSGPSGAGTGSTPSRPDRPVVDGHVVIPPKFAPGALLEVAPVRAPGQAAAAARRRRAGVHRADRRHPHAAAGGPTATTPAPRSAPSPPPTARLEVWILGSSGGESAQLAGSLGAALRRQLPREPGHPAWRRWRGYRDAFRPSASRSAPWLMVSADVVVAPTDAEAERLASGYGLWVRSIRTAAGAIPFPSPEEAAAHQWTDDDRRLVADRVATQFVGSPERVADDLRVLVAETGADELIVTTITHDHADRVRSYELLAEAWAEAW